MKKIICLIFTAFIVFSCSIDGKSEEVISDSSNESRSYAPWILCPTRDCGNHNMGLHQTYTYKSVEDTHVEGKCNNCSREYYHKQTYTERTTKHQCVMSGGCGYTVYTKDILNKKCIPHPREGEYMSSWDRNCYDQRCSRYRKPMLEHLGSSPAYISKVLWWGPCGSSCPNTIPNVSHWVIVEYRNVQNYRCGGEKLGFKCLQKRSSKDKYFLVCYKE